MSEPTHIVAKPFESLKSVRMSDDTNGRKLGLTNWTVLKTVELWIPRSMLDLLFLLILRLI